MPESMNKEHERCRNTSNFESGIKKSGKHGEGRLADAVANIAKGAELHVDNDVVLDSVV